MEKIVSQISQKLKKCPLCGKTHVIKSMEVWDDLSPKEKTKAYETEHRIFRDGYWRSYDQDNETWEFYLPLIFSKISIGIARVQESITEKEQQPFYGQTDYEKYQLLDEDDYQDW
jgi:hypothetical protein